MGSVNVGIVGLGYWGPNLVRNFHANVDCDLKYACDLIEKNRDRTKSQYPTVEVVADFDVLLKDKELDLICIATPPETHYALAKSSIEAGKHVLIEKPMTTNVKDGKELIALAKKNKVKIFVDHTFLFSPPVRKMKEMVEDGTIGDPLYLDSERINLGLLQKDVNVVWDLAIHDFSIINYLFPKKKVANVRALGSRHRHPKLIDLAHVIIDYDDGFSAHVHVSWLSPVKIRKTIVSGADKMMWYDDVHPSEKIKVFDKGVSVDPSKDDPFHPTYRSGDILIPKLDNFEPLATEVESIIRSMTEDTRPEVGGEEGLAIVELLEACDKALSSK